MQDLPRLHHPQPLAEGAETALAPAQAHYLGAVMRRREGDAVRLFNAASGEWRATLTHLRKDRATCRVAGCLCPPRAEEGPWLVFALLKRDATDLAVRLATELGAAALLPVTTARTNAARVNLERLTAIATEAAEQCERLSVPVLHPPQPLMSLLGGWPAERRLLAALERVPAAGGWSAGGPAALLVGPEGGFGPGELDALRSRPFVTAVSFGARILRAETAVAAGLALLDAAQRAAEPSGETAGS